MASCCATGATGEPGSCPVCGARGQSVPRETLEHLLKPERRRDLIDAPYHFCRTPECDILYFADAPLHFFDKDDLTIRVGEKENETFTDRCGCWTGEAPDEVPLDGCDVCHHRGFEISAAAMRTHLPPEHAPLADPGFRFCATESCQIVYFNPATGVYFSREDVLPVGRYKSDYSLRRDRKVYPEPETKTFKVGGITCLDCITHIARSVKQLPGAQKISGNLTDNTVKVRFEPDKVSVEQIVQAIEAAGYPVEEVLA